MDTATFAEIRASLEAERARLALEIDDLERESAQAQSETSGENNYRDHMGDQGSATFGKELDMTLEGNAHELYAGVVAALTRMDAGTFGVCARCGGDIGTDRLAAVPAAELCIACKEWEESR
jgi:RNA polymerase-binding transcription factor DksA